MSEPGVDADIAQLLLVSLVVAHSGRITLLLGGVETWRAISGYTLIPATLPAGTVEPGVASAVTAVALGRRWLGVPVDVLPSEHLYGASAEHAIDRLPTSGEDAPLPLLRVERRAPVEQINDPSQRQTGMSGPLAGMSGPLAGMSGPLAGMSGPPAGMSGPPASSLPDAENGRGIPRMQRAIVRAYRAALSGEPQAGDGASGVLWLAPAALRLVMRGAALAELLALPTVAYQPARDVVLPDDAFVYAPAEYGERALLRIVAKYGPTALFQSRA